MSTTTAKAIGTLFPTFNTATTVRKPFDVLTMIEGENSFTGTDAQGDHYDALKVYWRFVPAQEAAVWDGEGRPPVGTVCEAQIPSSKYEWARCEIVWHHPDSDGSAAVVHGDGRLLSWSGTFRPIRTPGQIAAEERVSAIAEMRAALLEGTGRSHATVNECLATVALYDAGYRKQVKP